VVSIRFNQTDWKADIAFQKAVGTGYPDTFPSITDPRSPTPKTVEDATSSTSSVLYRDILIFIACPFVDVFSTLK